MGRNIDVTQISDPSKQQPFTGPSLDFLQTAYKERIGAAISAIIGTTVATNTPYVLTGCTGSAGTYTTGYVYYNGEVYLVGAATSFSNTPIQYFITTGYDGAIDPITFSDGSTGSVHQIITAVPNDVASGGDFTSDQFVYTSNPSWITVGSAGAPAFQNSWTNVSGLPVKFRKVRGNKVELKGLATVTSYSGAIIFTLPSGYFPNVDQYLTVMALNNSAYKICQISVDHSTGSVLVNTGINWVTSGQCSIYFDGVYFNLD